MQKQEQLVLEPLLEQSLVNRRKLLPLWIKIFIWLFMITGAMVPFGFVFSLFGMNFKLALFGLESTNPLDTIGLIVSTLFLLKGIAAFALWTEKDWAIRLATIEAFLSIAVCVFVMLIYPAIDTSRGYSMSLRLELALIIPYLLKLQKIKPVWEKPSFSR